jgi:hypothetical protein
VAEVRNVLVPLDALAGLLADMARPGGCLAWARGWPPDARVVGLYADHASRCFVVQAESDQWPPPAEWDRDEGAWRAWGERRCVCLWLHWDRVPEPEEVPCDAR